MEKYVAWFERAGQGLSAREFCGEGLADVLDPKVLDGLDEILSCVQAGASGDFKLAFDPTLVRGMSYYTGTIFEVELPGFSGSIAGGGRYDEMVGHFCEMCIRDSLLAGHRIQRGGRRGQRHHGLRHPERAAGLL